MLRPLRLSSSHFLAHGPIGFMCVFFKAVRKIKTETGKTGA